jgi:hypothetical protein
MWFISYREKYNFIEVTPHKPTCLHQPHQLSAVSPKGEQKREILKIQEKLII